MLSLNFITDLLRVGKQRLYDSSMNYLQAAVDQVGGQVALAAAIGVKQQHVWNWLNRGGNVPPKYCASIELATGGAVTRRQLRPDDWRIIWPELVADRKRKKAIA